MAFRRVGAGLPGLVAGWTEDVGLQQALVLQAWEQAAGSVLAARTRVLGVYDGCLRVRLRDRAWEGALREMQPELLRRLAAALGGRAPRAIDWV